MEFKQRKGFRNVIPAIALTLASFLAGNKASAEEIKVENKTEPFSLETTLIANEEDATGNLNGNVEFAGEYNFDDGYKVLGDLRIENGKPTKTVLAAGNDKFYAGTKWQDLSNETTLLENANLFKLEAGIRNIADFLDISSFLAYTSIPNMRTRWRGYVDYLGEEAESYYETPLQLYTLGVDVKLKHKFKIKESDLTPWFSAKGILNTASAEIRNSYLGDTSDIDDDYDDNSFAWAFNHFNLGLGGELSTRNFDLALENYADGNYYPILLGTEHKIKASLHDKDKRSYLGYAYTINPHFNWLGWPATFDSESEINFKLNLSSGLYLKGIGSRNHSTLENNLIAVLGYSDKGGNNAELFYNLQDKMIGISISNKELGSRKDRYSDRDFAEMSPSSYDIDSPIPWDAGNVERIHNIYGENVSDVINYIKSRSGGNYYVAMAELSKYASYFRWKDYKGTFSPEKTHDTGYGVCRDTNGRLYPTVINGVLQSQGYKSWGRELWGPYIGHALTIIKKPNNRYDLMDYENIYFLNAKTEWEAVEEAYPGIHAYGGGEHSESAQRVIDALEESVWR